MTWRVGFIGAGQMATALARGLVAAGFTSADQIVASDVYPAARQQFAAETTSRTVETNAEVVAASQIVILAVKPQQMSGVLAELKGHVTAQHLVISIAAGVPLKTLVAGLGEKTRLVRVMPNTPCLVGASASGFAIGGAATKEDAALVEQLLSAVGVAVAVDEKLLDAVTGLSGSGPAYVYQIIEALSDGGVRVGLPRCRDKAGGSNGARRGEDGARDGRASGDAQGCGDIARRNDDRRTARTGTGRSASSVDERRRSRDESLERTWSVIARQCLKPGI